MKGDAALPSSPSCSVSLFACLELFLAYYLLFYYYCYYCQEQATGILHELKCASIKMFAGHKNNIIKEMMDRRKDRVRDKDRARARTKAITIIVSWGCITNVGLKCAYPHVGQHDEL